MPWVVALESARRNKANRAMAKSNRTDLKSKNKTLNKRKASTKKLAPRFVRSNSHNSKTLIEIRKRFKQELIMRILKTGAFVAIVVLLIVSVMA